MPCLRSCTSRPCAGQTPLRHPFGIRERSCQAERVRQSRLRSATSHPSAFPSATWERGNIIGHHTQVMRVAVVHDERFVTPCEEVAAQTPPRVKADAVSAQKPFHPSHEVAKGRFDQEMKVIPHQAPGVDLPPATHAGLGERRGKHLAILTVLDDRLATVHHVVDGPRILDSKLSWHTNHRPLGSHYSPKPCKYRRPRWLVCEVNFV